MLIENNTLLRIDNEDVIDGVFVAPDDVLYVGNYVDCKNVVKMILPNVIEIGDDFLFINTKLKYLYLPKVERIGNNFLYSNMYLNTLVIPNVVKIGNIFLLNNISFDSLEMPNIKEIGDYFLNYNSKFKYTPNIIKALKGDMYIGGEKVDKTEYIRKLNLKKLLC